MKFNFQKIKKDSGQILIITAMMALFVSTMMVLVFSTPITSQMKNNRDLSNSKLSFFNAESINEDVVYRIKNNMNVSPQESLSLNGSLSSAIISDLGDGVKEIVTEGNSNERIRKIKSKVRTTAGTSFNYGLFSGQGGIFLENNAHINGSIYSNGKILGDNGVIINGDVFVATQIATTTSLEKNTYNDNFDFGKYAGNQKRVDATQSFAWTKDENAFLAKISLYLKKVGSPANIGIKITKDKNGKPDKNNIIASGIILSNLVSGNYSFVEVGFGNNPTLETGKTYWIVVDLNRDDNNYYTWGFDNSDGTAKYSQNWLWGVYDDINGTLNYKLWANNSQDEGIIDKIFVNGGTANANGITNSVISGNVVANYFYSGTVYGNVVANNISNCVIFGDANFNSLNNCFVRGDSSSPAPEFIPPAFLPSPISEANISGWEDEATSAGTISSGNYYPANFETIGPGVIDGNLILILNRQIYINGPIYVKGNIQTSANVQISLSSGYQSLDSSAVVVADGWIDFGINGRINTERTGGNHLMFLSLAECDEIWGMLNCNSSGSSIFAGNNLQADVLTAPYGMIKLNLNVRAASLYASKLYLYNNMILDYEQGLNNINFSSGPSGTWQIESWREIK